MAVSRSSNANSYSMASKPCLHDGFETCLGDGCNHPRFPQCDNKGCDYNPFRVGATDFFGRGKTVDTNEPFTWVSLPLNRDQGNLLTMIASSPGSPTRQ